MLTEKKKLIFLKKLFPILIISICLLMSIGYTTVNDVFLNVEGEAVAMIPEGIYVTDIVYQDSNAVDFSNSNINVVDDTLLNHNIVLSTTDSDSYIKYKIEIFNGYDYNWEFKGVSFDPQFYDNSDITYTLDESIHAGDVVKSHEYVSFYVTFKYVDGVVPGELNNILNAHLNYEFVPCAILMATSGSDTSMFRSEDYKEYIKNINFEQGIDVPDNAIESWDIGVSQTRDVMAFVVENEQTQGYYDLYIQSDKQLYGNEDMSVWFSNMKKVDSIKGLKLLNTSYSTNMRQMFYFTGYDSQKLTLDVSGFDTSNVVNMSNMFQSTGRNSLVFTLDVSGFDTSKVTDMSEMFESVGYSSTIFTLDVSGFDTSKVTNMYDMFVNNGASSPNFTLDVSNFDTSNVTNMSCMFYSTGYGNTNFTLDVSNFDTSKVITMSHMFYNTGRNSTIFNIDVSGFDTSNVTDMTNMFYQTGYHSSSLNTEITIRNPNLAGYAGMFFETAIQTGSKITVNYTSETSDLVDQMILTKSENSNVVKGWNVDNITFDIEGRIYEAEPGMTWADWYVSEYIGDLFILTSGCRVVSDGAQCLDYHYSLMYNDKVVSTSDLIIENASYREIFVMGSGEELD